MCLHLEADRNKMTPQQYDSFIALIHQEVKPALGCTEPIAVALAVAKSCEILRSAGCEPSILEVAVSANILKNAMGVGIPGTGMVGLPIAAALASVCGKSEYKLEVLRDLTPEDVGKAKEIVADGKIKISLAKVPEKLYVKAEVSCEGHSARCIIKNSHDAICETALDGKVLLSSEGNAVEERLEESVLSPTMARDITMREIYEFATTVPLEKIEFMQESVELNKTLSKEGLEHEYGLRVGRTLLAEDNRCVYGRDYLIYAMADTAAASDARMAGCTLPAMSNSGSGNQGITVTVPVISIAERTGASHEELMRALALAHLTAIHIKGHLGKLSALCGCVIASTGAACGICLMRKGGYEKICATIKNMTGNITGMVCDGAKVGCALKVAAGVASALQSAVLALDGISASSNDGIIDDDIEKTIANLGKIGSVGMQKTDEMILDIMVCK